MGEIGCYTMDLYCDTIDWDNDVCEIDDIHEFREFPVTYNSATSGRCRSAAKKDGWLFKRNGKVFCPKCSGKKQY